MEYTEIQDMLDFIAASPTSFQAVEQLKAQEDRQRAFYSDEDCYRYGNCSIGVRIPDDILIYFAR